MTEVDEGIIRVMPETLANKIAAGEVVQRPASVLKELVENSLDAGAKNIEIVLKDAGSTLVQVVDDGSGMSTADARACFKRHATSKIRSVDDLERIYTLGFRGEALASIASVSHVELTTKRSSDTAGLLVRVEGGQTVEEQPTATPDGTSIAVRNLFFNVPARRNFLKTPATEFKHLVETFQFLSLANPEVSFSLHHNGNEVYRLTSRNGSTWREQMRRRIGELFGSEHAEKLLPVEDSRSYLNVRGFIGHPTLHRRTRGEQFFFVNGRYVKHYYLDHAVREAYEGLIPEKSYPFYSLFLELDPRKVDVNVHPTKAEVKFDDEHGMYATLKSLSRKALGMIEWDADLDEVGSLDAADGESGSSAAPRFDASPYAPPAGSEGDKPHRPTGPSSSRPANRWEGRRPSANNRHDSASPGEVSRQMYDWDYHLQKESRPELSDQFSEEPESSSGDVPEVWQALGRYLFVESVRGLLLVDQKAAHERVLYERALATMEDDEGTAQQLLFPYTLNLNPSQLEITRALLPHLSALGFDAELIDGPRLRVTGVPTEISPGEENKFLRAMIEAFDRSDSSSPLRRTLARRWAARNAVGPGVSLSEEERERLVKDLFACDEYRHAPSGNRTFVHITEEELVQWFSEGSPE